MAGTQNQPLEYEQVTYNSPDGAQMGRVSTEAIGFWGKTPVTRYVGVGAASTYSFTNLTSSTVGFQTAVDFTSFVLQVSTITTALRNCGIID
jgi:hypothetical protein